MAAGTRLRRTRHVRDELCGAKARFGVLAYFATVLRLVASLPVAQTEIVVDGTAFEMPTVAVLVANCGQIVPGLLGPRVTLDPSDGVLDVIAIRGGVR